MLSTLLGNALKSAMPVLKNVRSTGTWSIANVVQKLAGNVLKRVKQE
jgi:hypothetical protein